MAIWSIFWLFGLFSGYLVYSIRFGILQQEQSGKPLFGDATPMSTYLLSAHLLFYCSRVTRLGEFYPLGYF
jgi:hypothetical protein